MELTVSQTAQLAHTDAQLVRHAIRSGQLNPLRRIGQTTILDDLAATAWMRSIARGRQWVDEVREAALDVASTGTTARLTSSERSRLRSRLRSITAAEFAHAAGGLSGTWARYTTNDTKLGTDIGPSATNLASLGIVEGNTGITFICTEDLDQFERVNTVTIDPYGNLGVVERAIDNRAARILLDTYLLGGGRESAAAAAALERACRGDA
jgi:hypothetical protein